MGLYDDPPLPLTEKEVKKNLDRIEKERKEDAKATFKKFRAPKPKFGSDYTKSQRKKR